MPVELDQEIDLRDGVEVVLNDVTVGAQIQGVEQLPPPLPGEVVFEIGDRSERPRPARRGPRRARWYAFFHRDRDPDAMRFSATANLTTNGAARNGGGEGCEGPSWFSR